MSPERKTFRRIGPDQRREAMICAMLEIIAEDGIAAATTRAVAARAGVTPGLIRHYFDSKDALLSAAYQQHMTDLTHATCGVGQGASAAARLVAFIEAGLRAPVVSAEAVSLWAGFLTHAQQSPQMHEVHAQTYREFRDHLQGLIADALCEAGRATSTAALRRHAIACNAVIDGLWLEGGVLPDAFAPGELVAIGLASIGAMLGLPLAQNAQTATQDMIQIRITP
ncbi:TetR family transcriptional regulator C-terminal domain-containing protein [Roseovarius sp. Pro17]|uniref:TetR family transcriptional regulator C-terminal domain-containing protein n=1 Tax=Roseovarius sp. Pro17 TaxID=3108175 RepID=UPI002D79240E|nr:TetR family transcriptional regulator C-terminal domain-containing protein [Roseovarius sp. Pro17]